MAYQGNTKRKTERRRAALAALAIALAGHAGTVAAQEAAGAEPAAAEAAADGGSDIIVTAQRRAQSLKDVPISVSVVDGEAIAEGAIRNLSDLTNSLPNVTVRESGNNDILSIRGVNSGTNSGFEQSVATFVDGVYRGRARSMRASLFDIEQIEVLRGPQSTFFGNNAIAGAFNITTKKPRVGEAAKVDVSALYEFNHNEYDLRAGISVPLGDTLAARIAVGVSGMDGWVVNDFTQRREPQRKDLIGRIALAWEPNGSFRSNLRFDAARLRTNGSWSTELTECPPNPALGLAAAGSCARVLALQGAAADTTANYRTSKLPTFGNLDLLEVALTNAVDIGDLTLTSTTTFFHHDFNQSIQIIPVSIRSPANSASWFSFFSGEKYDQFTQELRLESPADRPVRWMLGAYYLHGSLDSYLYASPTFLPFGAFAPPALGFNAQTILVGRSLDTRKDNVFSGFAAVNIDISERFRLNLGGRYSIVDKTGHRVLTSGTGADPMTPATFAPGTPAQQGFINALLGFLPTDFPNTSRTDKAFMPSAGLEFDLDDDFMAYASYSRGEKAGGWSIGTAANEFDEEKVDAFELGVKGDLFDRRLFVSLALYKSNYKGLQEASNIALPNGSFVVNVSNAAGSVSKGVELGLNGRVNDNLTLTFDGAYNESRYTDFPNAPCNSIQSATVTPCIQDLKGRIRYFAPKWSSSIGANVTVPVGADYEIRFHPTLSYRSKFYMLATLDPLSLQKGYATLDARFSFGSASGSWNIALLGKNLTNERYATVYNTLAGSPGSSTTTLDRPRSIAVQAQLKF